MNGKRQEALEQSKHLFKEFIIQTSQKEYLKRRFQRLTSIGNKYLYFNKLHSYSNPEGLEEQESGRCLEEGFPCCDVGEGEKCNERLLSQ